MKEARTEDNKLFKKTFIKYPDYVMKIMASWMTLDELEGARTIRYLVDSSGTKETKQFTYRQPFGLQIRYIHQVDDYNNQIHAPISLESTRETKFCPGHNFSWYLAVSEVNMPGHFKNCGVVQPGLDFWRALLIHCLENKI